MDILVKYIGNDDKYWSKIKQRFATSYSDHEISFVQTHVDDSFNARNCFIETYKESPQILYVDFSINPKKLLYLTKLLNRNNEMRLTSIVGLFEYKYGWEEINKAMLASMRLFHFKSSEIHDVVFDPISLLDVELAKSPEFVEGKEIEHLVLEQVLRLSYVEDDKYHIETNSYLEEGSIITLDKHPLNHFTSSNRFYIKNFSTKNLYYNSRYSYDLEFTYEDSPFFQATEESWITYKKYRHNPLGFAEDIGDGYDEMVADVKKRKTQIRPMREKIQSWLKSEGPKVIPKKLKVLIIDKSLEIFNELNNDKDQFPYSLNIQTELTGDFYQIERTMPKLIVVNFDEVNNEVVLSKIINKIKLIEDYNPYIILFNYNGDDTELKSNINYSEVLTYPHDLDINIIKKLGKRLDDKYELSKSKSRVYLNLSNEHSSVIILRESKIHAMTESVLYLESELDIPNWTVFKARTPVEMLLTVVPHKESGHYKSIKNCYRCLINGVGEKEKAEIRSLINSSLRED
jgi:hypothetical protein